MAFQTLEVIYHVSGILITLFLLLIALLLRKENQHVIKSRIFLKYNKFKTAFYIAFIGAVFFLIGNLLGLYSHEFLHWMHDVTEIIYNVCLLIFIIMVYNLIRAKRDGIK